MASFAYVQKMRLFPSTMNEKPFEPGSNGPATCSMAPISDQSKSKVGTPTKLHTDLNRSVGGVRDRPSGPIVRRANGQVARFHFHQRTPPVKVRGSGSLGSGSTLHR